MPIQSVIKAIQDIMRNDQGVAGDGQRIEQLGWMLFLKLFDDQERTYELEDPKYKSPIPEKLRWRNWAADKEGITGDELLSFIKDKLFPTLKELPAKTDKRALIVREVFEDSYNYMRSGTLIRQVVNKINEIDFNKRDDRHLLNDIYEQILKDLQSAGNYGEFYTPRPLTKFVVEMLDPKLGEIILDPACGTGGFLVNALEYVRGHYVKTAKDEQVLHGTVRGTELKSLPHLLAITNMILHGVEVPDQIRRGDMLGKPLNEYTAKDRVDVIVANPPFGGAVKDGTESNFPSEFRTKETADLFLLLFIHLLKPRGRVGIVLPDGTLFGEGVKAKIKEKLLSECNVHTIIRLPQGVFNPYAGVNTNLVFFEKGEPTKEVWYYQLPLPAGLKQYTKTRGITHAEFEPVKKWWGGPDRTGRVANDHAWKVSIADIRARNWN
ncbi:MAG: SAM-dependent DNA methyltransferase, partial [Patescibacteria group bacterium]|nr:SAM-dependent DNA methyltransferase [Patescibacteria group bacterium]